MSQNVTIHVEGRMPEITNVLAALRSNIGPALCRVWQKPQWQPKGHDTEYEQVADDFVVEVLNAGEWADAQRRVAQAVAAVDPDREIIKGGDIDKTVLE